MVHPTTVRLDDNLRFQLEIAAELDNVSVSDYIRKAIINEINNKKYAESLDEIPTSFAGVGVI